MILFLFYWGLSFAARISLDTHVHYQTKGNLEPMTYRARAVTPQESRQHFESVANQPNLERFFLLSEAYLESDLAAAKQRNIDILAVSKNSAKAIPVCGISVKYDFYQEVLQHCLSLELRGLKIHLGNEQALLDGMVLSRIIDIAIHLPTQQKTFILTHFYYSTTDENKNVEQTQNLIALSQKFPNIQFIIAHAGTGNPKMIEDIATFYQQNPSMLKNIYLETSTLFDSFHKVNNEFITYEGYSLKYYRELFYNFGLDRVLYGSDTFVTNPVNQREIDFLTNSGFTTYEQDQILYYNGIKFLASLAL